jgi:hypothetical protein
VWEIKLSLRHIVSEKKMKSKTLETIRSVIEFIEPSVPRKAYLTTTKRQSYTNKVSRPLAQGQSSRYQRSDPDASDAGTQRTSNITE